MLIQCIRNFSEVSYSFWLICNPSLRFIKCLTPMRSVWIKLVISIQSFSIPDWFVELFVWLLNFHWLCIWICFFLTGTESYIFGLFVFSGTDSVLITSVWDLLDFLCVFIDFYSPWGFRLSFVCHSMGPGIFQLKFEILLAKIKN